MANKQVLKELQSEISKKHHLDGGAAAYFRRFNELHGGDLEKGDVADSVGKPEGFGFFFEWDRGNHEEVELSVFINAADPLGIMIAGAKTQDTISVSSASGMASFSESDGSLAASIIALTAAVSGGTIIALGGSPEATKILVEAATKFAEQEFKQDKAKKARRDAFGIEPSSQNSAKREGGVLICLPAAGGPYYSGSSSKFNLKSNGPRLDSERPAHVKFGFFLVQGDKNHMTRRVGAKGEIYIIAWDHKFEDNAGFYHVRLKLTRGPKFEEPGGVVVE